MWGQLVFRVSRTAPRQKSDGGGVEVVFAVVVLHVGALLIN